MSGGGGSPGRRGGSDRGGPHGGSVGPALHLYAPHDGEATDHDAGGSPHDRHVSQPEAPAAHDGEAPEFDVEALGHDDLNATPEGHGGDLHLLALDLGPAQIHVAAAHDGDGVGLAADAPAPLRAVPAHDGDVPAAGAAPGGLDLRGRGRLGHGQVHHDGLELTPRLGLERQSHPLGELVEREPALDHVLAEQRHGPVAVGVGHTLAEGATTGDALSLLLGNREVSHAPSLPGPGGPGRT